MRLLLHQITIGLHEENKMSDIGFDLAITQDNDGVFDLQIDDGDFISTNSFNTSILMTVFCEQRANSSEVPEIYRRGGWWGNLLSSIPNFEIGSKIWLYYQSRKTQDTLNGLITASQVGFNWLVDYGYAQNVNVTGEINREGITITVKIFISKSVTDAKSYDLWLNTGLASFNIHVI